MGESLEERAVRQRCDVEGALRRADGRQVTGRVLELSASGAFFETRDELEFGERVTLYADLPGSGELFSAEAEVCRLGTGQRELPHRSVENLTVLRPGVGLRFTEIAEEERGRLHGYLELLDER